MTFILFWWLVDARKWFKGPKYVIVLAKVLNDQSLTNVSRVNIEHQMLGRAEASLEGIRPESEKSSTGSSAAEDKADRIGTMA